MSRVGKIYQEKTRDGNLVYPQTVSEAVIDSETGQNVKRVLENIKEAAGLGENYSWTPVAGGDSIKEDIENLSSGKVDKVTGKVLSDNNYTTAEKSKVGNLPENTILELSGKQGMLTPGDGIDITGGVISSPGMIPVTYSELKTLKNNSQLIPGQFYQITDYTCTTSQEGTRSANHPFDIIVQADSESILNENAHAALHSGDTYFAGEKLEAWELKYCIDNDGSRFAWADTTNGKGVIYYMKDEYGNEIDYDFKNIQFLRDSTWKNTQGSSLDSLTFGDAASYLTASDDYYYTFTYIDGNNVVYDMSLYETYKNISGASKGSGAGWICRNNKIISNANDNRLCYKLSNNIFVGNETGPSNARFVSDNQISGGYSNTFGGRNIFSNTFLGSFFYNNTFADGGHSSFNYVNGAVYQNIFNGQFQNNYFYGGARQNTFKDTITYNVFMGDWLTGVVSNKILRGCRFGSKIQYVKIDSSGQIDSYVIDSGLHGTSSNPLLVTLISGSTVERHIAQDSDGNIVDYVPADLASAISQIDLVTAAALTNLNNRIDNE